MKKLHFYCLLFIAASMVVIYTGCKSGKTSTDEIKPTDEVDVKPEQLISAKEVCTDETKLAITIQNYGYGMDGEFAYLDTNFTIVQSTWNIENDSMASLKLSNYKMADLVGERKDDQVDIIVELHSKNGKKLEVGAYPYQEYSENFYSGVTMVTAKGTVYFNWVMGMPEQGDVIIDFFDDNNVCGSFALNVEKPDNDMIGIVRINGTFRVLE